MLLLIGLLFAADRPIVTDIGVVGPNRLAVTVREGNVTPGTLQPYQPQDGDKIDERKSETALLRGGEEIGLLVGPEDNRHLRTFDAFSGDRLPANVIDDAKRWTVELGGQPAKVRRVARKSFITDGATVANKWSHLQREHVFTLELDKPLRDGRVSVQVAGLLGEADVFRLDSRTVSPAIHVTAVGFRSTDPGKRAYVSWWSGDAAMQTPEVTAFEVVNTASGVVAHRGTAEKPTPASQADDYSELRTRPGGATANRSGVPVVRLDLTPLSTPGTYVVRVPGLGVSKPFAINRDVYRPAWTLTLQGIESHRRNVDLEIPLHDGTTFTRPAAEDRVVRTGRAFDGLARDRFDGYAGEATGEAAESAFGGWMDAGDFDTNHNHSWAAALLADLVTRHPQRLGRDDLGLRDSGDGIPDLLNEAMWHVDAYVRMQRPDGGVPSSIEYAEHPNAMEPSWLNTHTLYETAPSTLSAWHHAIAAASVARALDSIGKDGSPYLKSAVAAMDWAKANPAAGIVYDNGEDGIWAAAEMIRSGHPEFGDAWTERLATIREKPWSIQPVAVLEAIACLLDADAAGTLPLDAADREAMLRTFAHSLNKVYLEGSAERSAFGVLKHGWTPFGYSNGTTPSLGCELLLRRYDGMPSELDWSPERARGAAVGGVAYALGGNPVNRAYLSGLPLLPSVDDSHRAVRQLLHIDTRAAGRAAPAGIVAYGTVVPDRNKGDQWPLQWLFVNQQAVAPDYEQWPAYENLHEYWAWPVEMEYTIWGSNGPLLAILAELDAIDSDTP